MKLKSESIVGSKTKAVLAACFAGNNEHKNAYEHTIVSPRMYYDAKEELTKEIKDGRNVLNAIIEKVSLKTQLTEPTTVAEAKSPMVFISHSSKDKDFAEALVDMLEVLEFDSSNLFCSSIDGYGIGLSEDIFETLRSIFNGHNIFVIFIHSPHYYNSPISLNEMGAAWVLKTGFCSFLTTDMKFEMMKGVVNDKTISIKVDADDAPSRLTQLKDKLISTFCLKSIDNIKWERKRQTFLTKVLTIKYEKESVIEETQTFNLDDDEIQVLKEWIDSGGRPSIEQHYMGNRVVYYLGKGYEVNNAKDQAEWEDFFERLLSYGLIDYDGHDKSGHPNYKLKKAAYDFVNEETINKNTKY